MRTEIQVRRSPGKASGTVAEVLDPGKGPQRGAEGTKKRANPKQFSRQLPEEVRLDDHREKITETDKLRSLKGSRHAVQVHTDGIRDKPYANS